MCVEMIRFKTELGVPSTPESASVSTEGKLLAESELQTSFY